ncbi:MAG: serine/threonine protein kinase [Polyangiaceae bacterium]|nr:serine/threonine protein kinase [Polyangiaceae bacterium]
MDLDVGDVLDGRYKLLEVIGAGGHGTVYRAEDLQLGSEVAIKAMHEDVAEDPTFKARTQREARAMGALSGTSATQVFALHETGDGTLYIVMELLRGKDLETTLRGLEAAGQRLPDARVAALFGPVVDTLEAAHARGIIHRDLKPANIFVLEGAARGGVRLLDFGLVKVLKADPLTKEGSIQGSPSYIAPEVWRGKPQEVDQRIDVFSLGATLFRTLAGRLPFEGRTRIDVLLAATRGPRPSLRAHRPDLPPEADAWVARALAIAPDARYPDVRRLWADLAPLLHG